MLFRQIFDEKSWTYTYLIASGVGREAVIIDPVIEKVDQYIRILKQLDLRLVKCIDTHIHADHISGMAELREKTNCVSVMGDKTPADVASIRVSDGEEVKIEGISLRAMFTPGHTSESFSYKMNDRVFTGDALLIRGTGRTDFQNGDPYDAYDSLFNKLLKLPEETLMYPGHDYKGEMVSTIGEEKRFNPRLQVNSADEYAEIMNNLNLPNPAYMDVAVPGNLAGGINLERQKTAGGIDCDEFKKDIESGECILVDLREDSEISKMGQIPGSVNVKFSDLQNYLKTNMQLIKDKKVLMYCDIGQRSTLAVQISASFGLRHARHLIGGIQAWKKAGLDIKTQEHHH